MRNLKKHEIVSEEILENIMNGEYEPGDLIPTEVELSKKFAVSRPTVRQGIQTLVDQGFLTRKPGIGTKVLNKKINQEFTKVLQSFDTEMMDKGLLPATKLLSLKRINASEEIIEIMNLEPFSEVYRLVRLRFANETPLVLVITYIPAEEVHNFELHDFEKNRLYSILAEEGKKITHVTRTLELGYVDILTSALLEVEDDSPVFRFKSIGRTEDERIMEYSISEYRPDMNNFTFEVKL